MIPKVGRGSNPVGLMSYLAGPGRREEHVEPHLVAGSPHVMAWYSTDTLSHDDALAIGAELEQTRRVSGTDVAGGHIWHTSLSLHKVDGERSDQEWESIATDFMRGMGFIDVEGKADTPWVAVRHGLSGTTGNDHIHLAVSLVRADGTRADVWREYKNAQRVARGLETKYGLSAVRDGYGAPGLTQNELAAARARGRTEAERETLGRIIRAASTTSETEDEFVRRLRGDGLMVRPRFESGGMDKVVGYSVALQPPDGFKPVFYAGSKIGRDLGLRVLREGFKEGPDGAAVAEWRAARFGQRVANPEGRETSAPTVEGLHQTAERLEQIRQSLRDVPLEDAERWRSVAGLAAGSYAALSRALEREPGDLARASDVLSKSAQVSRSTYTRPRTDTPRFLGYTGLTIAAARGGAAGDLAVFAALSKLTRTLYEHNKAANDLVRERNIRSTATNELARVYDRLNVAPGGRVREATSSARVRVDERNTMSPVTAAELTETERAATVAARR